MEVCCLRHHVTHGVEVELIQRYADKRLNTAPGFICFEVALEHPVLFGSVSIRIFQTMLLQKADFVIFHFHHTEHIRNGSHVFLFRLKRFHHIGNETRQNHLRTPLPEGIRTELILNQHISNAEDILFTIAATLLIIADIIERIVGAAVIGVDHIDLVDLEASFPQIRSALVIQTALRIGDDGAFLQYHDIRHNITAGFTGTGRTNDKVDIIAVSHSGIIADGDIIRQQAVRRTIHSHNFSFLSQYVLVMNRVSFFIPLTAEADSLRHP